MYRLSHRFKKKVTVGCRIGLNQRGRGWEISQPPPPPPGGEGMHATTSALVFVYAWYMYMYMFMTYIFQKGIQVISV